MRAAIIAMMVLLLPAALLAAGPTMGIYFDYRVGMTHSPMPMEQFTGYVYADNSECYIDGVEFAVAPPPGIELDTSNVVVPPGSIRVGNPLIDMSISYWPPLSGFYPGYNLLCELHFTALTNWCIWYGGTLIDAPLAIVPALYGGGILGSCWHEVEPFMIEFTGLTSILCPDFIGTEAKSWGAIKSLF